jgi:hypothetical protein
MRIVDDEFREVIFAHGHGMLGIWVLRERQIVAATHVTWLGCGQRPQPWYGRWVPSSRNQ